MVPGLSANSAQGTMGSSAGGAAQAGGQTGGGNSFGSQFGESNNLSQGRRKRSFGYPGYGFGPFSQSNANALGGGSALFGQVTTNNNAYTNSGPYGSTGMANGNTMGSGHGINLFNAANSQSNYGRRKRQVFLNPGFNGLGGFGTFNSAANANALGTGSALAGTVGTNNNAFSQTNPFGASAMGASNAFGEGHGVQLSNAANSNSQSGNFF